MNSLATFPINFIRRFQKAKKTLNNLNPGEGAVVEVNSKKCAVYKNPAGEPTVLSPVCTHLGCEIQWNALDKTWDCLCHGSKFDIEGNVKHGPASKSLQKITL